jgi:hypothetical protein
MFVSDPAGDQKYYVLGNQTPAAGPENGDQLGLIMNRSSRSKVSQRGLTPLGHLASAQLVAYAAAHRSRVRAAELVSEIGAALAQGGPALLCRLALVFAHAAGHRPPARPAVVLPEVPAVAAQVLTALAPGKTVDRCRLGCGGG